MDAGISISSITVSLGLSFIRMRPHFQVVFAPFVSISIYEIISLLLPPNSYAEDTGISSVRKEQGRSWPPLHRPLLLMQRLCSPCNGSVPHATALFPMQRIVQSCLTSQMCLRSLRGHHQNPNRHSRLIAHRIGTVRIEDAQPRSAVLFQSQYFSNRSTFPINVSRHLLVRNQTGPTGTSCLIGHWYINFRRCNRLF